MKKKFLSFIHKVSDNNYLKIHKKLIHLNNFYWLNFLFFIGIISALVLCINSLFVNKNQTEFILFCIGLLITTVLSLLNHFFKNKVTDYSTYFSYINWVFVLAFLILTSFTIDEHMLKVSVMFAFLLMPAGLVSCIIKKTIIQNSFLIFLLALNLILPGYTYDTLDILFVILSSFMGLIMSYIYTITKVETFNSLNIITKERDNYALASRNLDFSLKIQKLVNSTYIDLEGCPLFETPNIINKFFDKLRIMLKSDATFLVLLDGKTLNLKNISKSNERQKYLFQEKDVRNYFPKKLTDKLFNNNTVLNEDTESIKEKYPNLYKILKKANVEKYILLPVIKENVLIGIAGIYNTSLDLSDLQLGNLKLVSLMITDIIKSSENRAFIDKLTFIDKLSGVFNRNAYEKYLINHKHGLYQENFGVIFLDIDKLKGTNDSLGHFYGDKLIKKIGDVLISTFGDDKSYRLGGDEFLVILNNCTKNDFYKKTNEFLKKIDSDEEIKASVGFKYNDQNQTIEELIHEADSEMYKVKKRHHIKLMK